MTKFETPEIKVIRFATPDVLTLSMYESYEGVKVDVVVGDSEWDEEDANAYMI